MISQHTPRVSVVIPTYGHQDTLLKTLDSVFSQTFRDCEVIVINDGSPDDTANRLVPFINSGRIRYFEQPNQGQAAARNKGLAKAKGEFVAFLDDDDLWPADKLAWQVEYLKTHPLVVAVGGACDRFDNSGVIEPAMNFVEGRITPRMVARGNPFVSPGQILMRTAWLNEIGGFDEALWGVDDTDLLFRLSLRWPVNSLPRVALLYRVHDHSASKQCVRMFENSCRMIRKHLRMVPLRQRSDLAQSYYEWLHNYLGRSIAFSYVLRAIGRKPYGESNPPTWPHLLTYLSFLFNSFTLVRLTFRDVGAAVARSVMRRCSTFFNISSPSPK
jgi:glycosyltransferase involved in cell wall biosynthesis